MLLTTYDIALIDQDFLSQFPWQFAVIDEAQRLKNPSSVCVNYVCVVHLFLLGPSSLKFLPVSRKMLKISQIPSEPKAKYYILFLPAGCLGIPFYDINLVVAKHLQVVYRLLTEQFVIPRKLLMTGTPIQNNLTELWALMHFCLPLVFGALEQFLSAFRDAADPSCNLLTSIAIHEFSST